jgi:hypothetical protein
MSIINPDKLPIRNKFFYHQPNSIANTTTFAFPANWNRKYIFFESNLSLSLINISQLSAANYWRFTWRLVPRNIIIVQTTCNSPEAIADAKAFKIPVQPLQNERFELIMEKFGAAPNIRPAVEILYEYE